MDEGPKLLRKIFCHDCQRDDIEGNGQRDGDVRKAVFKGHVCWKDSSQKGRLISALGRSENAPATS